MVHASERFMSEKYRTTAFFNGVNTFRSAFPDLRDALIEWREKRSPEDERPGELRKTGFRRGNFTQGVLACSNPNCHEGGYEVDRLVDFMLRLQETRREGMMLCSGREVGEEVKRGPVRCPHRIAYRTTLELRAEDEKPPKQNAGNRRSRYRPRRRSGSSQR
jgi:hypothetical protein